MSLIILIFERLIIILLYIPEMTLEARIVYDDVNRHHLLLFWILSRITPKNEVTACLLDTN